MSFQGAYNFIGWYLDLAHKQLGISKDDAYRLYLAYHEGFGGYKSGRYRKEQWLLDVSRNVAQRAATYRWQLSECHASLPKKPWYDFL